MKKSVLIFSLVALLVSAPALAGSYRHGPYSNGYRGGWHHRPYHGGYGGYYHRHHNDYWAAWGIGLFTGAVVSQIFLRPPSQTVIYERSAPVVVERHYLPSQTLPAPEHSSARVAVTVGALNVRSGPGTAYDSYGVVPIGTTGRVIGVSQDGSWWVVAIPPEVSADGMGWVNAAYVTTANTEGVPVVEAP